MARIIFSKVSALPSTMTPNTVYFVNNGNEVIPYLTDNTGSTAYNLKGGSLPVDILKWSMLLSDGVFEGFTLSNPSGLDISLSPGKAFMGGSYIEVTSTQNLTLSPSSNVAVCIDNTGQIVTLPWYYDYKDTDTYLTLYHIITDGSGITSLTRFAEKDAINFNKRLLTDGVVLRKGNTDDISIDGDSVLVESQSRGDIPELGYRTMDQRINILQTTLSSGRVGFFIPRGNRSTFYTDTLFGGIRFSGSRAAGSVEASRYKNVYRTLRLTSSSRNNRSCVARAVPSCCISGWNGVKIGLKGSFIFAVDDSTLNTSAHMFAGVSSVNNNLNREDPTTLSNSFGVIQRQGDTEFSLYLGGISPGLSIVPLGPDFPITNSDNLFRVSYLIPPQQIIEHIHITVENLKSGVVRTHTWRAPDLGVSSLLTSGVALGSVYIYRSTNNSSRAVSFRIGPVYEEQLIDDPTA